MQLRKECYESYDSGKGSSFENGDFDLEDLQAIAKEQGEPEQISGHQNNTKT